MAKSAQTNLINNISIRSANKTDVETIVNFCCALNNEDPTFTGDFHFNETAVQAALEELLAAPSLGRAWLVYSDNTPIGYVVLTFGFSLESHGRDGILDEIYIAPAWRRQGIGTQVVKFVVAEARRLGLKKLYLEVERNNHLARTLYQKLGFEDFNRYLLNKPLS